VGTCFYLQVRSELSAVESPDAGIAFAWDRLFGVSAAESGTELDKACGALESLLTEGLYACTWVWH
jgi:hypothetical protein